jgi:hypothetical protein
MIISKLTEYISKRFRYRPGYLAQSPWSSPGHGLDSDENLMTASRSILMNWAAKPLSRSSRRYTLLRLCASLIFIRVNTDGIISGSSYRRQNSSTGSFPPYPGVSRAGRRRRESLYSVSAPWISSSDIFQIDIVASQRRTVSKVSSGVRESSRQSG